MININRGMKKKIETLEKENAELKAHVSELVGEVESLISIIDIHSKATGNNFAWAEVECAKETLAKSKEQSLATIQAKAIKQAAEMPRWGGQPDDIDAGFDGYCQAIHEMHQKADAILADANKLRSKA